jgi:hypothetical protein
MTSLKFEKQTREVTTVIKEDILVATVSLDVAEVDEIIADYVRRKLTADEYRDVIEVTATYNMVYGDFDGYEVEVIRRAHA